MESLVDIHCHVLHGVDDGAKDLEESISLCRTYVKNGFTDVIATPHYIKGGRYSPSANLVINKTKELNDELKKRLIPLKIHSGMEIRLTKDTCQELIDGKILTLNNSRYVLIELPDTESYKYIDKLLFDIQDNGFIPIIAHPEREMKIISDMDIVRRFVSRGALLQVSKGSIEGDFGKAVKKCVHRILNEGLACFIATDAHRQKIRTPNIRKARKRFKKMYGSNNFEFLISKNTKVVLLDDDDFEEFEIPKSKKYFYLKIATTFVAVMILVTAIGINAFNRKVDNMLDKFFTPELMEQLDHVIDRMELEKDALVLLDSDKINIALTQSEGGNLKKDSIDKTKTSEEDSDGNIAERTPTIDNNGNDQKNVIEEEISRVEDLDSKSTTLEQKQDGDKNKRDVQKQKDDKFKTGEEEQQILSKTKDDVAEVYMPNISETFTTRDRARVVRIVYDSIPEGQINYMISMLDDGITDEDINEAKDIMRENLTRAQIDELRELYVKFVNSKEGE